MNVQCPVCCEFKNTFEMIKCSDHHICSDCFNIHYLCVICENRKKINNSKNQKHNILNNTDIQGKQFHKVQFNIAHNQQINYINKIKRTDKYNSSNMSSTIETTVTYKKKKEKKPLTTLLYFVSYLFG